MSGTSDTEEKILRKGFSEIAQGYCEAQWEKSRVFLKHFDLNDQIEIDEYYESIYSRVKEKGLPTNDEAFEFIKSEGLWTRQDDRELTDAHMFLEGMTRRRESLIIPSQIDALEKQMQGAKEEVQKLELKKNGLLNETCESYSEKKVNDFTVWLLFYKDPHLVDRLFTWKEFYEIEKSELNAMFSVFLQKTQHLSTANIKQMSLAPFFMNYFNLIGKNTHLFFDKQVYQLSYNQVTLLSYAKVFQNILENVENIPDEIRDKPDALLDFAESSKKAQKFKSRAGQKDGYSVVGASKQDMKKMGIGRGDDTVDISQLARAKGGKLGLQDFA